jgi:hypothetical protein
LVLTTTIIPLAGLNTVPAGNCQARQSDKGIILHDLKLKLTAFPAIPLDVVQDVILLGYGLYLIRSHRVLEAAQPAAGTPEAALSQEPRVAGS